MKTTMDIQTALFSGFTLDRYRPRKVVFYGRVSTQHEAQVNALENQMQWYDDQAALNKNWRVVGRYIDEGITGTLAKKRPNFMKMIEDAKSHKFDLIVTREVCRFARNTVDTLVITRELKNYGIEVYFVSDNIWTMDNDGELRLTIMATMAQEESRKISERVLAGQKISRDNGVLYGNGNILGYDLDRINRTYIINTEQAETVRLIYELYAQSLGMKEIVNELVRMGRKKSSGKPNWDCVDVSRVLRNATYMGCVCHNKSKVNNYLEKKRINNLDETSYEIREGNFPAIISPELWFRCEQIRKSRHAEYKMPDGQARRIGCQEPKNLWAQILRCRCGSSYHRFKWRVLKSGVPVYGYQCRFRTENASKSYIHEHHITSIDHCEAIHICEWKLELMAKRIFEQIWGDQKNAILQACQMLDACSKATALGSHQAQKNLLRQIEKAEKRLSSYAAMRADGEIDRDQFLSLSTGVKEEIQNLRTQMDTKNAVSNAEPIVDLARVKKVLATMIDVSSPKISDALISEFVEVVTPIEDYCYRWKLNFNPDSPRNVQTDLTHPNTPPVLCFSITFENAKEYRQANQMPTQFRRCAWNDLHVEVYM